MSISQRLGLGKKVTFPELVISQPAFELLKW